MTYLTFGEGELENANHFLSLYSYFSPCYLISHHSLYLFITKFGYNARCHRWKERALWEYGA